jgi:hypothetical protein
VKELIRYLMDNMYLDFQGDISLETVRGFLREDESREARQLLSKIIEEKGIDDLLITLADCLKEHIQSGVNENIVREQLQMYAIAGCDEGTPTLSATGDGPAPNVVWMSPGRDEMGVGLVQSIRIQFDRYLLPDSAVRQGICLQTASPTPGINECPNGVFLTPEYDPVDRVLAYVPPQELQPNTRYTVRILAPQSEDDRTGIRAFDGVPLAPEYDYGFTTGNSMTPTVPEPVRDVDFCLKAELCKPLPANVCSSSTASIYAPDAFGPQQTFQNCAAGSSCHGLSHPPPIPVMGNAAGSAFMLTTTGDIAGIPAAVQQLVAQSVVATQTGTAPNPKAPQRGSETPFAQNMPYIDAKNPGNSYLLYKVIIGMAPSTILMEDVYSCAALRAAGWMGETSPCTSTAPLTSTPPVVGMMGQPIPAAVESWIPEGQSKQAAPGENDRLRLRIRGQPMTYPTGGMPAGQARTLSAWIARGAASHDCP